MTMTGATHKHSTPHHEGVHAPPQHAPPRGGPSISTAVRVRLRRRRTNTTRRAHLSRSTTKLTPDMPGKTRLRKPQLTKTGCAHAGLCTRNTSQNTSSTQQPRTRECRQPHTRPNGKQTGHKAAKTTVHQPNRCRNNNPTINRPHASRPTPNQPGMQGSKRERRPKRRRHHGAPRPPTTISTNTTEQRNSTIIQPTNQRQQTTSNPGPPGRAQARPSQEA